MHVGADAVEAASINQEPGMHASFEAAERKPDNVMGYLRRSGLVASWAILWVVALCDLALGLAEAIWRGLGMRSGRSCGKGG
jgi:hypothetical protein